MIHLDALMRRLIHLRGPFPIVIGGTGRIAVVMLPQMHHFMGEGGQHRVLKHVPKEAILRQLGQRDQQQDEEYYQPQWQEQALPVLMLCLPTLLQGSLESRSKPQHDQDGHYDYQDLFQEGHLIHYLLIG